IGNAKNENLAPLAEGGDLELCRPLGAGSLSLGLALAAQDAFDDRHVLGRDKSPAADDRASLVAQLALVEEVADDSRAHTQTPGDVRDAVVGGHCLSLLMAVILNCTSGKGGEIVSRPVIFRLTNHFFQNSHRGAGASGR